MKYLFMSFIAVFFPWVIMLLNDNPGSAIIALIMQATVIGWIPASIWALRVVREMRIADLQEKIQQTTEDKTTIDKND